MYLRRSKLLIPAQGAFAIIAFAAAAMWPPVSGRMLLVPVHAEGAGAMAKAALADGAMLMGRGPFPGSLVVTGRRSGIARHIPRWGAVILAAPPAGCGDGDMFGDAQ